MARTTQHHNLAPIGWRPRVTFGDRLRMVRRAYAETQGHQVGQRDMAQLIGWGEKAYLTYEAGYHVPNEVWRFCLAVSGVTGCDPTWLAGDELPPPGDRADGTGNVRSRHYAWNAMGTVEALAA